jgi:hypothetical protein
MKNPRIQDFDPDAAEQWIKQHRAGQQYRRVVVWGCAMHRTPRGQERQGCADQGELLTRADIPWQMRRTCG